jgi:hypothetical protein
MILPIASPKDLKHVALCWMKVQVQGQIEVEYYFWPEAKCTNIRTNIYTHVYRECERLNEHVR